jgi:hypothetical protein
MASTKNAVTEETTAVQEATQKEPTFKLDVLRKNCLKLFGVTQTTFAGATAEIKEQEYSINEMKSIIENWCGKAVK